MRGVHEVIFGITVTNVFVDLKDVVPKIVERNPCDY